MVVFLQNRKHVCQRCIFINFCIRVKFLYVFVCFCVARFICIKFIVFIFYYWFVFVSNGSFKFVIVLSEKLSKKSKRIKLCGVFFRENCVRQRSMWRVAILKILQNVQCDACRDFNCSILRNFRIKCTVVQRAVLSIFYCGVFLNKNLSRVNLFFQLWSVFCLHLQLIFIIYLIFVLVRVIQCWFHFKFCLKINSIKCVV